MVRARSELCERRACPLDPDLIRHLTPPLLLASAAVLLISGGADGAPFRDRGIRAPGPAVQEPEPVSALDELEAWLDSLLNRGMLMEPDGEPGMALLEELLAAAEREGETSPEALARRIDLLVELATAGLESLPQTPNYLPSSRLEGASAARSRAVEQLDELLVGPLGERCSLQLSEGIIDPTMPHAQRQLGAWLCSKRRETAGRQALMMVARSLEDRLRPFALFQLSRWPDPAVDLFLVRLIGRSFPSGSRPHPLHVLLDRVESTGKPLAPRAATELALRLGDMLLSRDWRKASRAVVLTRGLEPSRRVPLLIGSLEAWQRRAEAGKGSPRIADDIVRELRRTSGRNIGTNPRRWRTWWSAVQAGDAPLHVARDAEGPRSSAGFFGLRAVSDRVTFILDISGSMQTPWRTSDHSRYVEAVDQMMQHLQAMGPEARFNVILFSSDILVSSDELVPCSARNLERARSSLLRREPRGGTILRPAVEAALCLDSSGNVDLERLEADTLIVLCDGDTASGRGWVQPLLRRIQVDAQVRVHCVLIGTQGDGTLEALAKGTGGDFVRID